MILFSLLLSIFYDIFTAAARVVVVPVIVYDAAVSTTDGAATGSSH